MTPDARQWGFDTSGSAAQVVAPQTGQPGSGPDLSTVITRFYGGTVDQAQPQFRLNGPGAQAGSCNLWNDPALSKPVNAPWRRILAVRAVVTVSAVVKTRLAQVKFTDNQNVYFAHQDNSYQIVASAANIWISAAVNYPATNPTGTGSGFFQAMATAIPDIWLPPGCAFSFGLGNFDTGDVMNEARILVQEAGPILVAYNQVAPTYIYGQQPPLS